MAVEEGIDDSAVFGDLVPLIVVDDVALEVEVSPMIVVSCAEKRYLLLQQFHILSL